VKSHKDVPLWVIKVKFNIKPLFIPQNRQILAQNWTGLKMFNNWGAQE